MGRDEKRRDRRFPADLTMRLGESEELVELRASNVSLGGAYCSSPRSFEPMTRFEVILEVPTAAGVQPLRTEAVVVRSEKQGPDSAGGTYNLALVFQRMSDEHRTHLMRFLGTYEH